MALSAEQMKEKKKKERLSSVCFGTDGVPMESTSQAAFTEKWVSEEDRKGFLANKSYLRGRHWELGFDGVAMQSESRKAFTAKKAEASAAEAAKALKKDLTAAHYSLGVYEDPSRFRSTYHQDMGNAANYERVYERSYGAARATSIVLGGDKNVALGSTSKADYVKHPIVKEYVDGAAEGAKVRASHVYIGDDKCDFKTTSGLALQSGSQSYERVEQGDTRKSHISFGHAAERLDTESRRQYSSNLHALQDACRTREIMDPEKKKDLRASHFTLGTDGLEGMQSISQLAYNEKSADPHNREEAHQIKLAMRKCYLTMGTDKVKYESTLRSGFQEPPHANLLEAAMGHVREERKRVNTMANFELGTDDALDAQARMQSMMQQDLRTGVQAVDYGQLTGLDAETKADLRKHHFAFGSDGRTDTSISKSSYIAHPDGVPSSMDPAQKAELRKHHFSFGEDDYKRGISSTSRDALQYHGRVDTGMDPKLAADLRAVHFNLGQDKGPTKSMYQSCFRRPSHSASMPCL